MYDTAALDFTGGIPDDAAAILFYVDGDYDNQAAARARFPLLFAAKRAVGLTVRGAVPEPGDDFEPGNWQGNVGPWTRACIDAGFWRPVLYADGSDMDSLVIPELEAEFGPLPNAGPSRPFRLLVANPDGDPTIPAAMDGKQYWWGSIQGGGSVDMDISACRPDFFQIPAPPKGKLMAIAGWSDNQGLSHIAQEIQNGSNLEVHHVRQVQPDGAWAPGSSLILVNGQVPKAAAVEEPPA
jgi:hypothetical protein